MKIVVCDTGPVLHLHEAELLDWLGMLGIVYVPAAVDDELAELLTGWRDSRPPWINTQPPGGTLPEPLASMCRQSGLAPGESGAIALAMELHADWLLTDDTMARVVAEAAGLEVHGSLGIVLFRAARGKVEHREAQAALDRLASSSLWLSHRVLAKARALLEEMR